MRRRAVSIVDRLTALVAFGLMVIVADRVAVGGDTSLYERALLDKQITPDAEGIRKYLRDLHPSAEQQSQAAQLIARLGSESFAEREQATVRLLIIPALPVDQLNAAYTAGDFETRWRAKSILEQGKAESATTLYAAFRMIKEKHFAGLVDEVLRAIPLCDKRHLLTAAREALAAGARDEDAPRLRGALSDANAEVRAAAVVALGAALNERAADDFWAVVQRPLEDDAVTLAAAVAMVNYGDRRGLPLLLRLLDAKDVYVRSGSSLALRKSTGQHFGFAAYDMPEKRAPVIAKWQAWLDRQGPALELRFPLDSVDDDLGYLNGNTLLAFGYKNKVAEFDPAGKEIWSYPAKGAWSAEKLSNGNVLIAAYNDSQVIEVDGEGKVVWKYDVASPLNARPLRNGNYLICSHSGSKILELDHEKNIVWEFATASNVCDAHRLENGNTMLCQGNTVMEITPEGKTEWEYQNGQPYGIQPLKNGNVLVCDLGGKVIEITREKEVVWEVAEPNPVDAFRLPNGNTLITGGTRFIEYSPDKKVVWQLDGANYGTARR